MQAGFPSFASMQADVQAARQQHSSHIKAAVKQAMIAVQKR